METAVYTIADSCGTDFGACIAVICGGVLAVCGAAIFIVATIWFCAVIIRSLRRR
jgi:hypothetical protein